VGKAQHPDRELARVERFVAAIIELPFDRAAAEVAARIRIDLEGRGMPIGPYDLLIAGQALANNLTLVTGNVQEFQRVAGLKIESWP
jgi:tRNA(fMet)-specific endonuclease VapC